MNARLLTSDPTQNQKTLEYAIPEGEESKKFLSFAKNAKFLIQDADDPKAYWISFNDYPTMVRIIKSKPAS